MRHDNPARRSARFLLGLCLVAAGCTEHSAAVDALHKQFPAHEAEVLSANRSWLPRADHFEAGGVPLGGLSATLGVAGELEFAARDGFSVQARESGVLSRPASARSALAFSRSNGRAYWTVSDRGVEEWLLVDARASDAVATWALHGAKARMKTASVIELLDDRGIPRLEVSAQRGYSMNGDVVTLRWEIRGDELSLFSNASGRLLVDPLWTASGSLTTARDAHTATLLNNGQVLVAGGEIMGAGTLRSSELYNPAGAGSWTATTGPLAQDRKWHTATLLADGRVLVVGGFSSAAGGTVVASSELYDPATGTWSSAGNLKVPRYYHQAQLLPDNRVIVMGGNDGGVATETAEIWDAGTWFLAPALITPRWHFASAPLPDGGVVVSGGFIDNPPATETATSEMYGGTWVSTARPMNAPRAGHTLTLLPDKRVLAAGDLGANRASAELLQFPTNTWALADGGMTNGRGDHAAAAIATGVVVTGGWPASSMNTAERFDPINAVFGPAGCMVFPRAWLTATTLATGEVLAAAGFDGGASLNTSERFNAAGGAQGSACTLDCQCQSGHCANSVCCDQACNGGSCQACSVAAGASADGTCTFLSNTTVCRTDAGVCDLAATCTGSSAVCPANALLPSTAVCRASAGVCDVAETCTGSSSACPANAFQPSTFVCRTDAGSCDLAATCSGSSATCPANLFLPSTAVCRSDAGVCDRAATCTGSSATCPANAFLPSTAVCRPAAGACDVAETCTGSSAACPVNGFVGAGVVCRPDAGPCDVSESCDGTSAQCPADQVQDAGSPGVPSCAPYQCDGVNTICPSSCQNDSQCPGNGFCNNGTCASKHVNGGSCTATNECVSGNCVSGVCCNSACTGACEACTVDAGAAANGTCSDVPAGKAVSSCAPFVCNGASSSCPTVCAADADCVSGRICNAGQCVTPAPDAGVSGTQGYAGWSCGCEGGTGDAVALALFVAGWALVRRKQKLGATAALAALAMAGTAQAQAIDVPRAVAGVTDVSSAYGAPGSDVPNALLHVSASGFYEVQSHNVGAEVGVTLSPAPFVDLGASAVLGQYIGGRVLVALRPSTDRAVRPFLQLRGIVHPVPGATVIGGGGQVGAGLEAGPGRITAGVIGEYYAGGPKQFETYGLFGAIGYELDLIHLGPSSTARVIESAPAQTPYVVDMSPPPEPPPPPQVVTKPPPKPPPAAVPMPPPPAPRPVPAGQAKVSVKIALPKVEFDNNKYKLKPKAVAVVKRVAAILKHFENIRRVRIDGYADDSGGEAAQHKLSLKRAEAVRDALVKEGIDASRFDVAGHGKTNLVVTKGSKKAREQNRRVEFVITDQS